MPTSEFGYNKYFLISCMFSGVWSGEDSTQVSCAKTKHTNMSVQFNGYSNMNLKQLM